MPIGRPLAEKETFLNVLLYGPEGTGKTTAALRLTTLCGPDQQVMMVDAEGGAKREALQAMGVDASKVDSWPEVPGDLTFEGLEGVLDSLEKALVDQPGCYLGVVFDSGTEVARSLLDQAVGESKARDTRLGKSRPRFQTNLEDYGVASAMQRDLLRRFRDLPCHMVWTALERRDIDDDGKVKYGPAMSPAVANDTLGLVDIVGYTMVEEVGGEMVRSAHFTPVSRRRAKDRFGVLPPKMPDPFLDRIVRYVSGDLTRDTDPVREHVRKLAAKEKVTA